MLNILKENATYFSCFALFLVLSSCLLLFIDKGEAILFFSENRTDFGDLFFSFFTKVGEEYTYILLMLAMAFVRFRYVLLFPILGVLVTILSKVTKTFFAQPRPITFFRGEGMEEVLNFVDGIKLYMGNTSFPSGHTMSGFALFTLLALMLSRKKTMAVGLFLIAFLIGLSRVYLVQHFYMDIFAGGILGVLLAVILFWLQNQIPVDEANWYDKSLHLSKRKIEEV